MLQRAAVILIVSVGLIFPVGASAEFPENAIGQVKTLKVGALVVRGEIREVIQHGSSVFVNDVIETDSEGAVGITFVDGSVLSLGPESQFEIEEYLFAPHDEDVAFGAKIVKGTLMYLSGRIAKLAPEKIRLTTPFATIGIRGTRFLIQVEE